MAKSKPEPVTQPKGNPSPFGSDELAAPHVGDDKHGDELHHGHAGYPSQADADIRLQRAQGDSRQAYLDTRPE
jgi:hypothetical protein